METLQNPVEIGPFIEETYLSAGLDYYKLTMSQLQFEKHPEAQVTFTYNNRGEQRIADYVNVEELQGRLDFVRQRGWADEELCYISWLKNSDGTYTFSDEFMDYLQHSELPSVHVRYDEEIDDIAIDTTGDWPLVTFWETIVMSEVGEMYSAEYIRKNNLNTEDIYREGMVRMEEKMDYLHDHSDVKVAEFGTRRRFSLRWQKLVVEELRNNCPDNIIGTSNVALAMTEKLKPIGTFAHELPMVYAGIAQRLGLPLTESHRTMLNDWYDLYDKDLSIALSDTFGSEFFFRTFDQQQSADWNGTRHDSGDPIDYGERAIKHYQNFGIDPKQKQVMFSDNLKLNAANNTVEPIRANFANRLGFGFGVGTNFTNDVGLVALNQVMKATEVDGEKTIKLSDDPGKHVGPLETVTHYQQEFGG